MEWKRISKCNKCQPAVIWNKNQCSQWQENIKRPKVAAEGKKNEKIIIFAKINQIFFWKSIIQITQISSTMGINFKYIKFNIFIHN